MLIAMPTKALSMSNGGIGPGLISSDQLRLSLPQGVNSKRSGATFTR